MKRTILFFSVFALCIAALAAPALAAPVHNVTAEAYFAPDGGIKEAVLRHIQAAKKSIRILSYYFSDADIADALAQAAGKGVSVEAVFDGKGEDKGSFLGSSLKKAGIAVYVDSSHNTMHNKVVIYDETIVQTGSYNLRKKVDAKNAENVVFLTSPELAAQYLENYRLHKSHSKVW